MKLASLKQHPLLFATILPISSRKKNEAGLSGCSAAPSLGWGCGMGSRCFARLASPLWERAFASLGLSLCDGSSLLGCVIARGNFRFAVL